jgi:hypothetical protein
MGGGLDPARSFSPAPAAPLRSAETEYTDNMTIDQRLEALTLSAQSWSHMHTDASKEYGERFRANEKRLAQLMDTMNRLGPILEIHDQHLDDHGDRLDNLRAPLNRNVSCRCYVKPQVGT